MDLALLQESWQILTLLCLGAYLLGSISSAILLCRAFGYPDPRTQGSSNPGATNVLRVAGKPLAAATLAADVGKGVVPVAVALWALELPVQLAALAGLLAVIGHVAPVFFRFRGGKGVATAFGLLFTLHWPLGLAAGAGWLAVFALLRISSVASLAAFVAAPVAAWFWLAEAFWPVLALSAVLWARHQSNIRKLLSGEELGFGKREG